MNKMEVIQPVAVIERKILLIRRQKIMPDSDLAAVYGVATKVGSSGNSVGKVNRYGVGRRHSGLSGIFLCLQHDKPFDSRQAGMTDCAICLPV